MNSIFILWYNFRTHSDKLRDSLSDNFLIKSERKISWPKKRFEECIARFYSISAEHAQEKANRVGNGDFTIFLVESPDREGHRTASKGIVKCNTLVFDVKKKIRKDIGGSDPVHCSITEDEFLSDYFLIFGEEYTNSRHPDPLAVPAGLDGWHNYRDMFSFLNIEKNYVLLRDATLNAEDIPVYFGPDRPDDLDFLVLDKSKFLRSINAQKDGDKFPSRYHVTVEGNSVQIDVRDCFEGYYDPRWGVDIIQSGELLEFIRFPSDVNRYYSTVYHALFHKQYIKWHHAVTLWRLHEKMTSETASWKQFLDRDFLSQHLKRFLVSTGYKLTKPADRSVHLNKKWNEKSPAHVEIAKNATQIARSSSLKELDEEDPAFDLAPRRERLHKGNDELVRIVYSDIWRNRRKAIFKITQSRSAIQMDLAAREGTLYRRLGRALSLDVIDSFVLNGTVVTMTVWEPGPLLSALLGPCGETVTVDWPDVLRQIETIERALKDADIHHGDLLPRNFIMSQGKLKVFDLATAMSYDDFSKLKLSRPTLTPADQNFVEKLSSDELMFSVLRRKIAQCIQTQRPA